jgi:DHA3 family multidrug efflux protein-like MFS transporter
MLLIAIILTILVILHLWTLSVPDLTKKIRHTQDGGPEHEHDEPREGVDIRGTIRVVQLVPGLFGLIFFHTFNNFLGGIFMSLMDAYGLLLVSVQVWGALWGMLSLAFIVGGIVVARKGLGRNPLRTLFLANIAMWTICIFFTIQSSIVLLAIGMFVWLSLIPAVEAAEQTILQKVVPPERQGRVFGFAQSVEQAATPVTAFLIGPIAQWIFIPFMTTGAGVELIGPWFGTGTDRGIALLFIVAGMVGLLVTLLAMRSNSYRSLSGIYKEADQELEQAYSS